MLKMLILHASISINLKYCYRIVYIFKFSISVKGFLYIFSSTKIN